MNISVFQSQSQFRAQNQEVVLESKPDSILLPDNTKIYPQIPVLTDAIEGSNIKESVLEILPNSINPADLERELVISQDTNPGDLLKQRLVGLNPEVLPELVSGSGDLIKSIDPEIKRLLPVEPETLPGQSIQVVTMKPTRIPPTIRPTRTITPWITKLTTRIPTLRPTRTIPPLITRFTTPRIPTLRPTTKLPWLKPIPPYLPGV